MGSSLGIEAIKSEIEDEATGPTEFEIALYPTDFTLKGLYDKWVKKQIMIPSFQRKFVWKIGQSSKLIESFLLGLPVPGVFFYKQKDSQRFLVVDGHQRLRSVFSFFSGRFPKEKEKPFRLIGLDSRWEGRAFDDFSEPDKLRLQDTVLRATVISQLHPKDDTSIYYVFERLNTGGTQLTNQEVRNCVYGGALNDLMKKLNLNADWRNILGKPTPDSRQKDIELILRILALRYNRKEYRKPMKKFLTDFMIAHQNPSDEALTKAQTLFEETCARIVKSLGKKPFHIRAGLNTAALDAVSVAFASNRQHTPANLKARFERLKRDEAFIELVTSATTDVDTVRERLAIAKATLFS